MKSELWLNQRLRREALHNFLEAAIFIFIGVLVQAIVCYCVAFVTIMVLIRIMAVMSLMNHETNLIKPWIIGGSVVLFIILSAHGALRYRQGLDYSDIKVTPASRVSGEVLKALTTLICEILFAGPRLLLLGSESFVRGLSQWGADRHQLATMIDWLLLHGPKVLISDLTSRFGDVACRLRDVPGIIWLPKDGVAILSEEIRQELYTKHSVIDGKQ
jgi:hypothetical protein